jgi:hypothetical protein
MSEKNITQKIEALLAKETKSLAGTYSDNNHDSIKQFIKDNATELTGDLVDALETLADESSSNQFAEAALSSARYGTFDSEDEQSEATDNADSEWGNARRSLEEIISDIGFMIDK